MTANLMPWPLAKFFQPNTNLPLAGGKVYTYAAGTATPLATYSDPAGTIPNANPVILNANGEASIYLTDGLSYKINLLDASNVQVPGYPIDQITNLSFAASQLRADLANTANSALGDALIGVHRTGTGAVAQSLHNWIETRVYNIMDFIDPLSPPTDWTVAINLAYARIPSTGGILEFPEGDFAFGTALSFTNAKPLIVRGQGEFATRLRPTFAAGNALTVNGPSLFGMKDLRIVPTVARTNGTYDLYCQNMETCVLSNLYLDNDTGGLIKVETCNFLQMDNVRGESGDASSNTGDTCLRLKSVGGCVDNTIMRTLAPSGTYSNGPSLFISGPLTSLRIGGTCAFSGGGPRSKFNVSGIVSTGANFTVTTSVAHDFQAGDFLVLRGCTPAAYNKLWRIASVGSSTLVVTSTANPGPTSVNGTAESITACAFISNEDGACNESSIAGGVLFEAMQTNLYGTVGLYFDGRRGTAGARYAMQGWNITGNYYDFGCMGVLLSGTAATASNDPTLFGFDVDGTYESITRGIHVDQACGITIGRVRGIANQSSANDNLSNSSAIYIYAGPSAPFSQGITINGSNIGQVRSWYTGHGGRCYSNGITLDSPGIDDLTITGATVYGSGSAISDVNGAVVTAQRWKIRNNTLASGAWPISNSTIIPQIASATNINIDPFKDVQKITGTTNIQGIAPGWFGKEVTLIFTGALNLVSGGNIAVTANYVVAAGTAVNLYNDGTSWYVR